MTTYRNRLRSNLAHMLWRVDTELGLVECSNDGGESWFMSALHMYSVDYLVRHGEWEEVPA